MGHTYCTVLCAGVKSGVRIHGTHWCRGRSVVRLVHVLYTVWQRKCNLVWFTMVQSGVVAARCCQLGPAVRQLPQASQHFNCGAMRRSPLQYSQHSAPLRSREPASARGYRGGPGAILPSLTPDLHRGGHSTKRSFASVVILGGHHEGVEEDQGKDWAEQQGGSPLPSRPTP